MPPVVLHSWPHAAAKITPRRWQHGALQWPAAVGMAALAIGRSGGRSRRWVATAASPDVDSSRLLRLGPAIASSFAPPRFIPAPYATNPHLMTILGAEVLFTYGPDALREGLDVQRRRYDTPDGDFFDVDYILHEEPGASVAATLGAVPAAERPMVVMLHGLESDSKSPVCCRMARAFRRRGFDVAIVCFRSCSGELNRQPGAYNLGFTADVDQLCHSLHAAEPRRRLFLSGFSLGANAICKFLGELGSKAADRGICGGAVACVPFAPSACSPLLENGIGKWLYSANFLRTLIPKAEAQAAMLKARGDRVPFDLEAVRAASTIGEFDEAFIAPIYGFRDKWDYYQQQGSIRFLPDVRVPVFAMNALDDPFIERSSLPTPNEVSPTVALYYPPAGGHIGFIADDAGSLAGGDPRNFLAECLADFVQHVEQKLRA